MQSSVKSERLTAFLDLGHAWSAVAQHVRHVLRPPAPALLLAVVENFATWCCRFLRTYFVHHSRKAHTFCYNLIKSEVNKAWAKRPLENIEMLFDTLWCSLLVVCRRGQPIPLWLGQCSAWRCHSLQLGWPDDIETQSVRQKPRRCGIQKHQWTREIPISPSRIESHWNIDMVFRCKNTSEQEPVTFCPNVQTWNFGKAAAGNLYPWLSIYIL